MRKNAPKHFCRSRLHGIIATTSVLSIWITFIWKTLCVPSISVQESVVCLGPEEEWLGEPLNQTLLPTSLLLCHGCFWRGQGGEGSVVCQPVFPGCRAAVQLQHIGHHTQTTTCPCAWRKPGPLFLSTIENVCLLKTLYRVVFVGRSISGRTLGNSFSRLKELCSVNSPFAVDTKGRVCFPMLVHLWTPSSVRFTTPRWFGGTRWFVGTR